MRDVVAFGALNQQRLVPYWNPEKTITGNSRRRSGRYIILNNSNGRSFMIVISLSFCKYVFLWYTRVCAVPLSVLLRPTFFSSSESVLRAATLAFLVGERVPEASPSTSLPR